MSAPIGFRLEKYGRKHPEEVLIVNLQKASGEPDTVLIYNGYSSSLMHSTIYDPDIPLITKEDQIISIDRLASPYDPVQPNYLQTGLTRQEMEQLLLQENI
ncbi:hypothetical protein Sta7437_3268 [Stanieria cyanosphaera PCC 7437]|uniref:DUF7734 domain-containing protein n=1 Tax=Stanieria cyanosphaera (strain ATCC 29371 / PCC 7437) TaxID=111780 RepID=K9XW10_STAC7|nr:hypothetical protein [Stanieria cyanosphaera]AFZ36775.1 hypothetical protein Sta7437_3268 [Stanieria cyanosphaera PCC 7437]